MLTLHAVNYMVPNATLSFNHVHTPLVLWVNLIYVILSHPSTEERQRVLFVDNNVR